MPKKLSFYRFKHLNFLNIFKDRAYFELLKRIRQSKRIRTGVGDIFVLGRTFYEKSKILHIAYKHPEKGYVFLSLAKINGKWCIAPYLPLSEDFLRFALPVSFQAVLDVEFKNVDNINFLPRKDRKDFSFLDMEQEEIKVKLNFRSSRIISYRENDNSLLYLLVNEKYPFYIYVRVSRSPKAYIKIEAIESIYPNEYALPRRYIYKGSYSKYLDLPLTIKKEDIDALLLKRQRLGGKYENFETALYQRLKDAKKEDKDAYIGDLFFKHPFFVYTIAGEKSLCELGSNLLTLRFKTKTI